MKLTLFPLALTFAVCGFSPARSLAEPASMGPEPFRSNSSPGNLGSGTGFLAFDRTEKAADAGQAQTEESKKILRHEFGFTFLVYRDKIQTELGLSADEKAALEQHLGEVATADLAFLQSKEAHQGEFEAYRSKALEKLESVLKITLSDSQRKRLCELVRQREGLFGGPSLWGGLQITDEQKAQFMAVIEPMHKKMIAVAAGAQHATNRSEFERRVLGLRADLERQMEAILTDSQRKQWKEMLGKPIAIDALYDLAAG